MTTTKKSKRNRLLRKLSGKWPLPIPPHMIIPQANYRQPLWLSVGLVSLLPSSPVNVICFSKPINITKQGKSQLGGFHSFTYSGHRVLIQADKQTLAIALNFHKKGEMYPSQLLLYWFLFKVDFLWDYQGLLIQAVKDRLLRWAATSLSNFLTKPRL